MARVCLKCNYERTPNELAPETECPQCGAIYAKIEKALRPPDAVPPTLGGGFINTGII